jgi:NADP-dependent 3-hydroxy acid dehydrogenase YdfG
VAYFGLYAFLLGAGSTWGDRKSCNPRRLRGKATRSSNNSLASGDTYTRSLLSLKNKVAIVTGGNRRIGAAIVLELAKQGANIVIDYVAHPQSTVEIGKQVAGLGDQAPGVEADVSKVAELQRLVDATVKRFGRLDVLVNNAGIETRTNVLDTTEAQFDKVMSINLKVHFSRRRLRPSR